MARVGGVLGVIIGFTLGILLVEVIFANSKSWPDVVPVALAVAGGLIGSSLGRRFARRRGPAR
jgi:uncharacterized membrane protein YfcA